MGYAGEPLTTKIGRSAALALLLAAVRYGHPGRVAPPR
jgi:hypothetical protein